MAQPRSAYGLPTRSICQASAAGSLVRRILEEAVRDCNASEATFWIVSPDGESLDGTFNHGPTPQILETQSVPVAGSVIGMVVSNGLAVSIGPDDYHHPAIDHLTGTRTLAMVASPVYCDGKLTGVVSAINPLDRTLFSPGDLERLSWKAYLIGLVLADALR